MMKKIVMLALRQLNADASALMNDLTEARPLIRSKLKVKALDGGQLVSGLVDCVATLDFVL
jgi:hypothetical protein